jgi:hypothetical protein
MKTLIFILWLTMLPLLRAQQPVQVSLSSQNTAAASWTSATTLNTRVTLLSNITAYNAILVTLIQGTTITGGVVALQQSNDNTNWVGIQCVQLGTTTVVGPNYTLQASTNVMFMCPVSAPYFGVLLSTAISGTGTVVVGYNALTLPQVSIFAGTVGLASGSTVAVTQPTAANLNATVAGSGVFEVGPTAAANTKTNPFFINIADSTNQITAALSALGTAPTGTEVMTVNAVGLPSTAAGAAVSSTSLSTSTSTTGTNIKTSTGNLYGLYAVNGVASVCWVQFMNSGSTGTLGTAPIVSFPLPASTTQPIWIPLHYPINFSTGIAIGTSTLNNGTVACGTATAVVVQFK